MDHRMQVRFSTCTAGLESITIAVLMAYIVVEPCIDCKNTICVTVCPVDCFREGERQLWIDPDECIDCGACVPECPVDAIYPVNDVPAKWIHYIQLNAEKSVDLPVLMEKKEPLGPGNPPALEG